jgi:SAM-dependent methyltransferase
LLPADRTILDLRKSRLSIDWLVCQARSPSAVPAPSPTTAPPDLTVVLPAKGEGPNLRTLLPDLRAVTDALGLQAEILIVVNVADASVEAAAQASDARCVVQRERGYGGALATGFAMATGQWVLTMDADLSHRPIVVADLWARRHEADVLVASRYAPGGHARMPAGRLLLSQVLNRVFSRGLGLGVRDMSSGFRLYRRSVLQSLGALPTNFDAVQTLLVRAFAEGFSVAEVPFTYEPRAHGRSNARVIRFGLDYLRTFWRLWAFRNSILCADYDARAHDSVIPLQRYWQRSRHRFVTELIAGEGPVLDVGCGSSRIIAALPRGSVAVDVLFRKLRYARRFGAMLAQASGFTLPFRDESFPCVLCSQVIEHVPKESPILSELVRVLKPGGRLVLGTPDYANWEWVVTEKLYGMFAPGAYADEHIAHYTRDELIAHFEGLGFRHEATRYILRGELILAFRKGQSQASRTVLPSDALPGT